MSLETEIHKVVKDAFEETVNAIMHRIESVDRDLERVSADINQQLVEARRSFTDADAHRVAVLNAHENKLTELINSVRSLQEDLEPTQIQNKINQAENRITAIVRTAEADHRMVVKGQLEGFALEFGDRVDTVRRDLQFNRNELNTFRTELADVSSSIDELTKEWARYRRQSGG